MSITEAGPLAFNPAGLVRGPDNLIYVSVTGDVNSSTPDLITGYILRFTLKGEFVDIFTSNTKSEKSSDCANMLHKPAGLVFGPDGHLYVTSHRAGPTDTDKVLIYNGKTGDCLNQIVLDKPESQVGASNVAYADALLFGPDGRHQFTFEACWCSGDWKLHR